MQVSEHVSSCEGKVEDMFGAGRESDLSASGGASSPIAYATFVPQPLAEGELPADRTDWIGGDEFDQSQMYFTGSRLKGQAKPRF